MKQYVTALAIREFHIKTTMGFFLPQSEWLLSRHQVTINAGEAVGERESFLLLVGVEVGAVTLKTSVEIFFRKLKVELPYDPAIALWVPTQRTLGSMTEMSTYPCSL